MNYEGKKFGTMRELSGLMSRSAVTARLQGVRVCTNPNDAEHPDGRDRSSYQDGIFVHGFWYNLEDFADSVLRDGGVRVLNSLCRKLGMETGSRRPERDVLVRELGEYCLRERKAAKRVAMADTDSYRVNLSATVDDSAMQSFGYKQGTSVRCLEHFLEKRPGKYLKGADYRVVRVPHQDALDFAAKTRTRLELWMTQDAFRLLNAEPVIAEVGGGGGRSKE